MEAVWIVMPMGLCKEIPTPKRPSKRVHLRSIFVARFLSAVAAFVLRFADRYHWLATIATRRFFASGLVMLAMDKVTRFHWNIGKFWTLMILRMMLDVDASFVGVFFNWNVSCIFITMHAWTVHIMIWNPDDEGWQELLGGLVSMNATTLGPRHKS